MTCAFFYVSFQLSPITVL